LVCVGMMPVIALQSSLRVAMDCPEGRHTCGKALETAGKLRQYGTPHLHAATAAADGYRVIVQRHAQNRLVKNGGRFNCFNDGTRGNGPHPDALVERRCEHNVVLAAYGCNSPGVPCVSIKTIKMLRKMAVGRGLTYTLKQSPVDVAHRRTTPPLQPEKRMSSTTSNEFTGSSWPLIDTSSHVTRHTSHVTRHTSHITHLSPERHHHLLSPMVPQPHARVPRTTEHNRHSGQGALRVALGKQVVHAQKVSQKHARVRSHPSTKTQPKP